MRAAVVAEARRWIGTPFVHQAHARGIGCDCVGLVGGVAVALGLLAADWWEHGFAFAGYARQPDGRTFAAACRAYMTEIDPAAAQPGDAVSIRFRRDPQHLGILAPYAHGGAAIVHAVVRPGCVTEHRLDARWQRLVAHAYRLPGVA